MNDNRINLHIQTLFITSHIIKLSVSLSGNHFTIVIYVVTAQPNTKI